MMNFLREFFGFFPNKSIPEGRCSSEKCPKCGHWSTRDEPHSWRYVSRGSPEEVMTCVCGHESRWILGPGIMICVDEDFAEA